jgi:lipoprotein-anchoring transpeptidase ErfK/SrfK
MRAVSKWLIGGTAALLMVSSGASDAKKFHPFGTPRARPQPVASAPEPQPVHYRWSQGAAPQAYKDMVTELGTKGLKPGQYVWASAIPAQGDTRIVLDLVTQMAYVYRDDRLVGATTISTAKHGMVTPLGFWSILEKRPLYRSKKYDNAPMPWMQRIDSYGIAMHGGVNPGFPASHGCIRLPSKFAQKLYGLTSIGSKVVIEG